jgi:fatty-acyl-CoA synthase
VVRNRLETRMELEDYGLIPSKSLGNERSPQGLAGRRCRTHSGCRPDIRESVERIRQLAAELVRAPVLVGRVIPELALARSRGDSLASILRRSARTRPGALALVTADETLTRRELVARIDARAAWLRARGTLEGERVTIVGHPSAEYVCWLLACSSVGATAVLTSDALSASYLGRLLELVPAKLVVASHAGAACLASGPGVIDYESDAFQRELRSFGDPTAIPELPAAGRDLACIFSSGTTGPARPSFISEERAVFVATIFARLVHQLGRADRLYCCLPLHHASGLLLGLGVCLVAGVPIILRERFSARGFFDDVRRYRATVALYIGELGRALLAQPPQALDREHSLRLLVGNGMGRATWEGLLTRFAIPDIAEFYAATEFPGAIVNLTGKLGSVGHVPLERLRGYRLVRLDATDGVVRGAGGFAEEPAPSEPGELVMKLSGRSSKAAVAESRILHDLFRSGDAYVRSGDLFRRDRDGYYWFVDRLGDAYRFNGELVSTHDVEELCERHGAPGVSIVGVRVPGIEGKVGLAAVVRGSLELSTFESAIEALPGFARPRFVRLIPALELGESFKIRKQRYADEGVDPSRVADPLYFVADGRCEPLTAETWGRIAGGSLRL